MGSVLSLYNIINKNNEKKKKNENDNNENDVVKNNDNNENDETHKQFKLPDDFYCSICMNTLNCEKELGHYYIKFTCKHYMHYHCLYNYLSHVNITHNNIINTNNSKCPHCPLCRTEICTDNESNNTNFNLFKLYCKYIVNTDIYEI